MNITRSQLKTQFDRVNKLGWMPFFQEAADTVTKGYFDVADLIAIGSRETNLDPKWLRQLGDGGHAGGLMQADIRSFPEFISSGQWKDARLSIIFGAKVLMLKWHDYANNIGKRRTVKGHSFTAQPASGSVAQHIVIASYNCGLWSQYCFATGKDIDKYTTGRDYGADVMQRAAVIRTWIPQVQPSQQDTDNSSSDTSTAGSAVASTLQQNADTIVNTGDAAPKPDPKDITMDAPAATGSVQTTTKVTFLGLAVPPFLLGIFQAVSSWIDKGYIDLKDVFSRIEDLIQNNFKYVVILIGLIVAVIALRKIERLVVFVVSMITHAIPGWNNVSVVPGEQIQKKWWQI